MLNRFNRYKDKAYLKLANAKEISLLRDIRCNYNSPFLNINIAEFIIGSQMLDKRPVTEMEIDDIINDAVFFFKHGDKREIKEVILRNI